MAAVAVQEQTPGRAGSWKSLPFHGGSMKRIWIKNTTAKKCLITVWIKIIDPKLSKTVYV